MQRTKAETVAKFFPDFIEKYKDWPAIAMSDISELEEVLKPIGLYRQRAKRLKALGIEMYNRGGVFPKSGEELMAIPFLGQYISNAVKLFSFNDPSPLLDVNMARALERFFGERKLADIRYDPYLQELAHRVINVEDPVLLNWAILDFGALVCKAQNPACHVCILRRKCRFYQLNKLGL
ncbi:MAG: hypothetical protein EOP48_22435 [Sphingobacteriales bacterium]|nr:MAG: hypothetical protein EOP48_22435 [Sphingobacteriales bacterium]